MTAIANSLVTNILVTCLMLVMVFLLPGMDRKISQKLGLNLQGGVSTNPRADALLRLRQGLLYAAFGIYLIMVAYLVFFSRSATRSYQIHVDLFADLKNAVQVDFNLLELLKTFLSEGLSGVSSHVEIVKPEDIAQVYMNIMLFVPMGYLLPYLFGWFRARVRYRPALACFIISFVTENLQLMFRRGFYDLDDLVSNTIGGIIGQLCFLSFAYVVMHPDWRREMKSYRRWKRHARSRTLYPFARKMTLTRTTLRSSSEEEIMDFYVMKLGFRLIRRLILEHGEGTNMLLEMGRMQLEIHCCNSGDLLPPQTLTLSVRRLKPVVRRMEKNGIRVSGTEQDPYTGLRCVHIEGPDGVRIQIIEN